MFFHIETYLSAEHFSHKSHSATISDKDYGEDDSSQHLQLSVGSKPSGGPGAPHIHKVLLCQSWWKEKTVEKSTLDPKPSFGHRFAMMDTDQRYHIIRYQRSYSIPWFLSMAKTHSKECHIVNFKVKFQSHYIVTKIWNQRPSPDRNRESSNPIKSVQNEGHVRSAYIISASQDSLQSACLFPISSISLGLSASSPNL
jgi:hypothetical protein